MENFIPQFQPIVKKEWADAVHRQIMSGWIGAGSTVDMFEKKLKEISGAEYAISTTSGTSAIMLAIHALNIPRNKKILFPSYTFLAGANAANFMGYEVGLVDVDLNTMCMCPDYLREILAGETSFRNGVLMNNVGAVIFVNHNGYIGEHVGIIKEICSQYNVPMIEDSSQALGIVGAGIVGDIGIYSFSVPKIISTGQGGAMITNSAKFANMAMELRDHGDNWRKNKIHNKVGINLKFDDIHASYGLAQLNDLNFLLAERKRVYDRYCDNLGKDYIYCELQESPWMIIYRTQEPGVIIDKLAKENIQAVQYYKPVHYNPPYTKSCMRTCEGAIYLYNNTVYLPSSLSLQNDTIDKICNTIKKK